MRHDKIWASEARGRPSWLLRVALFFLVACLRWEKVVAMAAIPFNFDHYGLHDVSYKGNGQGILLFAYGMEKLTTTHFLREAFVSARRIKLLNPTVNITLVTNPGLQPQLGGAFDAIINVEQEHILPGQVPSWTPNGLKRQWFTRLEYLARSPYEVTLALDSQALCCAIGVEEFLKKFPEDFDVAFAVQGPRLLAPHNWAILYRHNGNTRRMFKRWRTLQIAQSRTGSDQGTLHMAAGSLALQDKLRVGVINEGFALATVPYNRTAPPWPRSSPLIPPGPVHFVHYNAFTQQEEQTTCEKLNRDTSRARVVFQPSAMPRSEKTHVRTNNTWEMVYSEVELANAARGVDEKALYFEDLDWDNATGKWGHTVTPWRAHYPGSWENLLKDVDEGIRRLMNNPTVRDSSAFIKEFRYDTMFL